MQQNTTGFYNIALGDGALNQIIGHPILQLVLTLLKITLKEHNYGIGLNALYSNTTGHANTAYGRAALYANTTGRNNAFEGCLYCLMRQGHSMLLLSDQALLGNVSGHFNTALEGMPDILQPALEMFLLDIEQVMINIR